MRWDGTQVVDFTPKGSTNRLFVNPIVLDPNNPALLYYAAGSASAVPRRGPTGTRVED